MLYKEASSTIFRVFGMTRPRIEPQSCGSLVNILSIFWFKNDNFYYNLFISHFTYIYICIYMIKDSPINFNICGANNSRRSFCLCLIWYFKPAINLHAGKFSDEIAGMTKLAFIIFFNTWRCWRWFLSKFLVALWHFALQTLWIEAAC